MLSPPCVSYSRGGLQQGLLRPDGLLLIDGFGVDGKCRGLAVAPALASRRADHHASGPAELENQGPPTLSPCSNEPAPVYHWFFREPTDWPIGGLRGFRTEDSVWQLHAGMEARLTDEQPRGLSNWALLPPKLQAIAPKMPDKVLLARICRGQPLPVLASAYYRQLSLPAAHLESTGAYTWLVQFGQGPVRYLHPAEAARLFGFGPSFVFPRVLDEATAGIGNAVAPAQICPLTSSPFQGPGCPSPIPGA